MLKDANVIKGIGEDCDTLSLHVVSTLNHWMPGSLRGKPVAVSYVLPIKFALE
jgi:hypothetical protein